jgi:hypothetical protein
MRRNFVGRTTELAVLTKRLARATQTRSGVAVTIKGRRQVGKSRLVQEFCNQAKVPYLFFTATKGESSVNAIGELYSNLRESSLPTNKELIPQGSSSWPDAFRVLASVLPEVPSIVVLDEVPWLSEQDKVFDGALQTAWDRLLATKPVLLLLLGSDLHMMERFTAYDRPFYGRADNLTLRPLTLGETAHATGLTKADAIDAQLITGGLPGILRSWPHGTPAMSFLTAECADPAAPVFSVPELALLAEFPTPDQAKRVIEAVGSGERTHANIAASAGSQSGPLPSGSLSPLLHRLVEEKQILSLDQPLSTRPGKPPLYRIMDSNLRFYLAAGRAAQEQTQRGRPRAASQLLQRRWTSWRGKAVEPLIRESLELAAVSGGLPWAEVEKVGGWWNRQFNPEIDLVGADRTPVARHISFVGSIKWLANPFDDRDLDELLRTAPEVPGFIPGKTAHVAVSLSGFSPRVDLTKVDLVWGAKEIVEAWDSKSTAL